MGGNLPWDCALPVDPEEVTPQPWTQARELFAQQKMSLMGDLWTDAGRGDDVSRLVSDKGSKRVLHRLTAVTLALEDTLVV